MREESIDWMSYAEAGLSAAKQLVDSHPTIAAYHAPQVAEKGLKSHLIHREGNTVRTHDLVRLSRQLEVPDESRSVLEDLNPADTAARYPGAPELRIEQPNASLRDVEKLLTWIQVQLNE